MNVLITIGSINPEIGGPARSAQGLCRALNAIGVNSWVMSFTPDERHFANMPSERLLSVKSSNFLQQKRDLEESIVRLKPDIIHCNGIWSMYAHLTVNAAVKFKVPLIISIHGSLSEWALNYKKVKKRIAWVFYEKRDLLAADAFQATSDKEVVEIKKAGFEQPVINIPNGIDFSNKLFPRQVDGNPKRVLFLSRIHNQKGLKELIEAWNIIRPENWILQITGTDSNNYQSYLADLVSKLGLKKYVIFTGPVSNEEKWFTFSQSDLFVLPSYSESFGIAIAESLAAGVPVITTKGTPWEIIQANHNEKAGWWIDIGVQPLVKALREAINLTDEQRRQMGLNGRKMVEKNYSWSLIAKRMVNAYEEIIKSSGKSVQ